MYKWQKAVDLIKDLKEEQSVVLTPDNTGVENLVEKETSNGFRNYIRRGRFTQLYNWAVQTEGETLIVTNMGPKDLVRIPPVSYYEEDTLGRLDEAIEEIKRDRLNQVMVKANMNNIDKAYKAWTSMYQHMNTDTRSLFSEQISVIESFFEENITPIEVEISDAHLDEIAKAHNKFLIK